MTDITTTGKGVDLVSEVRRLLAGRLEKVAPLMNTGESLAQLMPGKMLRTRLAAQLAAAVVGAPSALTVARVYAATEMVHTASLCHDDVIDCGLIRRGLPTLWRLTSPSGAVLVGDMLLCEAVDIILQTEGGRHLNAFVARVREVCAAELEQEVKLRGKRLDLATCLRLARGKTGPLFAFTACICGGEDEVLSAALEEAGYRVGTAYQLADDLVDVLGREEVAGKTLGTDTKRAKFTLADASEEGQRAVREQIAELCGSALDCLRVWPRARRALGQFLADDLRPVFSRYGHRLDECLGGVI